MTSKVMLDGVFGIKQFQKSLGKVLIPENSAQSDSILFYSCTQESKIHLSALYLGKHV